MKSRRKASSRGVPNIRVSDVGIREFNSYTSSARRFTKSMSIPCMFIVAVSRCLDWDGLAPMTPILGCLFGFFFFFFCFLLLLPFCLADDDGIESCC